MELTNRRSDRSSRVRRADLLRQRGEAGTDAWAAHRNLLRLKVAAVLAILDKRFLISEEDWHLAGIVVDVSDGVRCRAQASIA